MTLYNEATPMFAGQVAINSKMGSVLPAAGLDSVTVMIAIGSGSSIRLMGFSEV
jgi:hypothetical protein